MTVTDRHIAMMIGGEKSETELATTVKQINKALVCMAGDCQRGLCYRPARNTFEVEHFIET